MTFGEKITELRIKSGFTHRQLATEMDDFFSHTHLMRVQSGDAHVKTLSAALEITNWFDLGESELAEVLELAKKDFLKLKKQYHRWEDGESLKLKDGKIECNLCGKVKLESEFRFHRAIRNRSCNACCDHSNKRKSLHYYKKKSIERAKKPCAVCGDPSVMRFKDDWLCDEHLNCDNYIPSDSDRFYQTSNLGQWVGE